jgi:hypothetical protein
MTVGPSVGTAKPMYTDAIRMSSRVNTVAGSIHQKPLGDAA